MAPKAVAECRNKEGRNVTVKKFLKLAPKNAETPTIQAVALLLLPFLLPATQVKNKTGNRKFSKVEAQEQFILYYEVFSTYLHSSTYFICFFFQTSTAFRSAMNKLWEEGVATQPTMAIIGETLSAEIVITNKFYKLEDPVNACMTLIRIYYVLDCCFPERAKNAFIFMVTQVFEMPDRDKQVTATMIALKNRLKKQ
jgi:hypothetical protein